MSSNRRKAVTWALGFLLLLLSGDFATRALLYSPAVPPSPVDSAKADDRGVKYIPPSNTAWNVTITEKNLFSETRTVRTAPQDASRELNARPGQDTMPVPAKVKSNVILSGIIKNQHGEDVAYLIIDGQPALAVRQGEVAGGVRVMKIERRKVTVQSNGESFDLTLSGNPLIKR